MLYRCNASKKAAYFQAKKPPIFRQKNRLNLIDKAASRRKATYGWVFSTLAGETSHDAERANRLARFRDAFIRSRGSPRARSGRLRMPIRAPFPRLPCSLFVIFPAYNVNAHVLRRTLPVLCGQFGRARHNHKVFRRRLYADSVSLRSAVSRWDGAPVSGQ